MSVSAKFEDLSKKIISVKFQKSIVDFPTVVNELDQKVDISRHQINRPIDLARLTKLKKVLWKKVAMPSYYSLDL